MTPAASARRMPPSWFRRSLSFLRDYGPYLWIAALPLLTAAVVLRRRDELNQIASALREANPLWLIAGVGVELLILLAIALTYRSVLRRLGHDLSCQTLLAAHLQRTAIGAISPLSGPTSVYVFLRFVKRRRVGTDDGLLTVALRSIAAQGAFLLLLVAALAQTRSPYLLLVVFALVVLVPMPALARQLRPGCALGGGGWTARIPRCARQRADAFFARARRHQLVPTDLARPLVFAVASRLGAFGLLFASLHALNAPASIGVVATAYCAGMLACLAIPVFQGTGAVEAAAALALAHGGVPAATAVGAVLLWRLLEFWLPILLGLLLQVGWMASRWTESVGLPAPAPQATRPLPAVATATPPAISAPFRREHHEEH